MLRHVDLCSGIGGFALGFEWAGLSRPVMFCDIEPWSRQILAKHWPDVPIEEDVKVLANEPERIPECSILTAGYPCQPFSQAGRRRGETDDRHIWPYIREIVAQKRPTWCVFENVYGHLSLGLDTVLSNLEADGYATRPFIVPACGVDAAHRRDRIWIIAHTNSESEPDVTKYEQRMAERPDTMGNAEHDGQPAATQLRGDDETGHGGRQKEQITFGQSSGTGQSADGASISRSEREGEQQILQTGDRPSNVAYTDNTRGGTSRRKANEQRQTTKQGWEEQSQSEPSRQCEDVADSTGERWSRAKWTKSEGSRERFAASCKERGWLWKPEPPVGRVAYGIPRRVDRLKGLGNAIVPQIAMQIGLTIKAVNDAI